MLSEQGSYLSILSPVNAQDIAGHSFKVARAHATARAHAMASWAQVEILMGSIAQELKMPGHSRAKRTRALSHTNATACTQIQAHACTRSQTHARTHASISSLPDVYPRVVRVGFRVIIRV